MNQCKVTVQVTTICVKKYISSTLKVPQVPPDPIPHFYALHFLVFLPFYNISVHLSTLYLSFCHF